jgi:hypothetical protein
MLYRLGRVDEMLDIFIKRGQVKTSFLIFKTSFMK